MKKFYVTVFVMMLGASLAYAGADKASDQEISQKASRRIVGGQVVTDTNAWPWMAAIVEPDISPPYSGHICGASLIHPGWILTAAHCIEDRETGGVIDPEKIEIVLGSHNLNDGSEWDRVKVTRVIKHPQYGDGDDSTPDMDIALLKLEKQVTSYKPVALYRGTQLEGRDATVTGWGQTTGWGHSEPVEDPYNLREVLVSVISNADCSKAYEENDPESPPIDSSMLCAGTSGGGKDSCFGDSGGPLVIKDGDAWKQVGVVSWGGGTECAQKGLYGVYARVSEALDFIDASMTGTSVYGKLTTSFAGHEKLGIANATVSIEGTDYSAETDNGGNFSILISKGGIQAGTYTVSVKATGLSPVTESVTLQGHEGEGVKLEKEMSVYQGGGIQGDFDGNGRLGLEDSIGILQTLTRKR